MGRVGWYAAVGVPPRMLGGMGWLAFRPGCWVVCGGWRSAPAVGWYGAVGVPPGFLRLMLRFTHTTQPTGLAHSNHRVGWVLGISAMCEGLGSLPKTQRFVDRSSWVVCAGWHSAPAVGWYATVGIPPGFLRLMLRFTHTTQPTGSNCSIPA